MTDRLRILKSIYGGDLCGRTLTMPSFGHPARDRGTSVTEDPFAPEGLLVCVHNGGGRADDLAAKNIYLRDLGEEAERSGHRARRDLNPAARARRLERLHRAEREHVRDLEARRRRAVAIWNSARNPVGTPVESYLAARALDLPEEIAGEVIRFHPACPWEGGAVTAMVTALRDVGTGEVVGVHRTALTNDARKIGRKMLGQARDAAVMLDAFESVTIALTIGEGIESTLAGRQLGLRPAWALGSVGAIAAFPILAGIETLTVLAENDASGASAAACREVGDRWCAAGRSVERLVPRTGKDFNDVVIQGRTAC